MIDPVDVLVVIHAIDETCQLVDPPVISSGVITALASGEDIPAPSKSILSILPPMSRDPEIAAQMRALSEETVRSHKAQCLRIMAQSLHRAENDGHIHIERGEEWVWLSALSTLRAALAGSLENYRHDFFDTPSGKIHGDEAEVPVYVSEQTLTHVFDFVSRWQESLIQAIEAGRGSDIG